MVTIKDLRELTLSLCSAAAPNSGGLGWIQVNNQFNVDKVVTLFIPGITQASLALQPLQTGQSTPQPLNARLDSAQPCLPVFSQLFSHYAPTKAAGDRYHLHSVMQTFITVPMSDKDKQKRDIERQKGNFNVFQ